ncbi:hypothetical protein ACTMSW_29560 [Micromonospora sp. BQ11]|uniref:hypothetical protein n=1 Tax=Micromonospora sp. BQ11 TaxID=3452212 RepID=UPI003F8A2EE7
MNERHTIIRSLHDVGAALWLGGSLMGAVGLNGASRAVSNHDERAHIASVGWAKWAPISAAAIGAHLIGGAGLLITNRRRASAQAGVSANTTVKTALTLAAVATTAYSGLLGNQIARNGTVPTDGATDPSPATPQDVAAAQRQQRILQWVTPALTAVIVALGAQQGEQQRPSQMLGGISARLARLTGRSR